MGTMMEVNVSLELSEEDLLFGDGATEERSSLSDSSICLEADRYWTFFWEPCLLTCIEVLPIMMKGWDGAVGCLL